MLIRKRTIVLVVCAILLLGLLLVSSSKYTNVISQRLVRTAQNQGISLKIHNSSRSGLGISFYKISSLIPIDQFYFLLNLQKLWIRPEYLTLLSSEPRLQLKADLYSGTLSASVLSSWNAASGNSNLSLQGINLADHQQIQGFGIRTGTLDILAKKLRWEQNHLVQITDTTVTIDNLNIPEPIVIPGKLIQLPLDLKLPELSDARLDVELQLDQPSFRLNDIAFKSSWGQATGFFEARIVNGNRFIPQAMDFRIKLSQELEAEFGPLLSTLLGGNRPSGTRNIRIQTKNGLRNLKITPIS